MSSLYVLNLCQSKQLYISSIVLTSSLIVLTPFEIFLMVIYIKSDVFKDGIGAKLFCQLKYFHIWLNIFSHFVLSDLTNASVGALLANCCHLTTANLSGLKRITAEPFASIIAGKCYSDLA